MAAYFYNFAPKVKTLVGWWLGVSGGWQMQGRMAPIRDSRGECQTPLGRAQTFLDEALVDSMKAHHEAGRSCAALAREYGLHKMTVARTLREAGVQTRRPPITASAELAHRVRGLSGDGLSERRIAQLVGVSRSSVHRVLVSRS